MKLLPTRTAEYFTLRVFGCLIPHREIVFKLHIIYNSVSRHFCKDKSVVSGFLEIKTMGTIYYAAHIEFDGLFRIILDDEVKLIEMD